MKNLIIFLDIDGVLTSINSNSFFKNCHNPKKYLIDEECFSVLEKIFMLRPETKVVIHSGWSKFKNEQNPVYNCKDGYSYKSLLPEIIRRLGDRYLGCVDHISRYAGGSKALEILNWITINIPFGSRDHFAFMIIDDQCDDFNKLYMLPHILSNALLVITDSQTGLKTQDIGEAVFLGL